MDKKIKETSEAEKEWDGTGYCTKVKGYSYIDELSSNFDDLNNI